MNQHLENSLNCLNVTCVGASTQAAHVIVEAERLPML